MDLRSWALVLLALSGCAADYHPEALAPEYDPFVGELPALILDAQRAQQSGKLLHIGLQRQLFDYGKANTADARPWILLARDSMQREWAGFAMSQYGLALRADARVMHTHNVLPDVLETAINYTSVEESDANALLQTYWGLEAVPAIDTQLEQMQEQGRDAAATKLMVMREALIASAE